MGDVLIIVTTVSEAISRFTSIMARDSVDLVVTDDRAGVELPVALQDKCVRVDSFMSLRRGEGHAKRPPDDLSKHLRDLAFGQSGPVYTHSPHGEYGGLTKHQDLSYLVHTHFANVRSYAWNVIPSEVNVLTREEFDFKCRWLPETCGSHYLDSGTWRFTPIDAVEPFGQISRDAATLYYWNIANFGNRHQSLGKKYPDMWGYADSDYERQRHLAIRYLVAREHFTRVVEIGAGEGYLSTHLRDVCDIYCVEPVTAYRMRLADRGLRTIDSHIGQHWDCAIFAGVLEYAASPRDLVRSADADHIITDACPADPTDAQLIEWLDEYDCVETVTISPRWEPMYHGGFEEDLRVMRIGANVRLFRRRSIG